MLWQFDGPERLIFKMHNQQDKSKMNANNIENPTTPKISNNTICINDSPRDDVSHRKSYLVKKIEFETFITLHLE